MQDKMKWLKFLPTCRSILCLDGSLPYGLLKKIHWPIIAADGAANKLVRNGIEPRMILGDMDSVDPNLLTKREHLKILDQDTTDFEKALDFIKGESLTPTMVTGIDGGYMDHIWNNVNILARTRSAFFSRDIVGMMMDDFYQSDDIPLNTKISLFGMPYGVVNSKGLKWELDGMELSIGGKTSFGNRTRCSKIELRVLSGKVMVCISTKDIRDAGFLWRQGSLD
ncbi:MAG: thiamine diphosphokinase [Puniceicoccales bacterium]|nr:thiamine diphosphokinase [Puniceicoccales bacterium]